MRHDFGRVRYNDILHVRWGDQQGLVLSYTEFDGENQCYGTTVALLTLGADVQNVDEIVATSDDWEILFRTKPCLPLKPQWNAIEGHMAGGRMAFREPATIYLGSGDYAWDGVYAPDVLAQDPDVDYGKVIEIDLVSRQARIVSTGHRNMQGLSVDQHGQVWVVEHGMRGGDELNLVSEGANYGWPEETLGTKYNLLPIDSASSYGRHESHTPPTFAWLPSVATSALTQIWNFHPSWDGDLLVGSLKETSLYRVRVRENRVRFTEKIEIGKRIRYAQQHNDGRLVLWTDDSYLLFLTVAEKNFADQFVGYYITAADYTSAQRNQVRVAVESCLECHSFVPNSHRQSPSLALMYDAPIASTSYSGYSEALKSKSGRWSRPELLAFLSDPAAYAPGTTMPGSDIDDPFVLEELVNILESAQLEAE